MSPNEPENLTTAEAVAHYRIGRTKLFELIASGKDRRNQTWQSHAGEKGQHRSLHAVPSQGRATAMTRRSDLSLKALKKLDRWVAWRTEGEGRKIPYDPDGSGKARVNEPRTWSGWMGAHLRAADFGQDWKPSGVGVVLGPIKNGRVLAGLDLDTCRGLHAEEFSEWATAIARRFDSYCEISPSGTGLKVFFLIEECHLPQIRTAIGNDFSKNWKKGSGKHPPGIELHLGNRYFTVTEQKTADSPPGINLVPLETIMELIEDTGPSFQSGRCLDDSRSGRAFRLAGRIKKQGGSLEDFVARLDADHELSVWASDPRQVDRAWRNSYGPHGTSLKFSSRGLPLSNLYNAAVLLRQDPDLQGRLSFDEMAQCTMLKDESASNRRKQVVSAITDADILRMQEKLQEKGLTGVSKETVHGAAEIVAHENNFHPVRDYLEGLEWDGIPRLDTWLSVYAGAEDSEYTRRVGRMFLIAMCARVESPGCKFDYMLILEGHQGTRKSTLCRILGGDWFTDNLPDLNSGKEVAGHIRGKWVVEISELEAMRKAEATLLKSFISRSVEKYRPPYARRDVEEPRQSVLIGTTNLEDYLKDETGGRRFWPVKVNGVIDTVGLEKDRDQLLAEAWRAHFWMEPYWPDDSFEREFMRSEQDKRQNTDVWEKPISDFLTGRERTTIQDVGVEALDLHIGAIDKAKQGRIARCLRRAGWEPTRSNKQRFWVPNQEIDDLR